MNAQKPSDLKRIHDMPAPKPIVLVLMGGPDAEREVSLMSGREVAAALRDTGQVIVAEHVIDTPDATTLREMGGDVVFPVLHGTWGEGGGLQTMLARAGLPFVGAEADAAALAMDKMRTKALLAERGVPMLPAAEIGPDDACVIEPPLVLKPVDDGSSVDLCICATREDVAEARAALHPRRDRLMAERYVRGRELTTGILLDRTLPLIEIIADAAFYDYEAKYESDATQYVVEPDVPAGIAERCASIALEAYHATGCRDLARVDFILGVDEAGAPVPWFLEINTMPGFTTHSLLPLAARHSGMDLPATCLALVEAALARCAPAPA